MANNENQNPFFQLITLKGWKVIKQLGLLIIIEVRFHKDLFSPIGYYSDSKNYRIVWRYFSDHNNGNEYPAFHISNKDLIDDAERHFDTLWQRSEKDILKVTQNNTNNKIKQIFQEPLGNK